MDQHFHSDTWLHEMEAERAETTDYFLNQFSWRGAKMPEDFTGPKWYPLDEKWRVPARLDRDAPGTGQHVQLQTSVGDLRDMSVYGTFIFTIEGQEQRLTAYQAVHAHAHDDTLFVPFKDATSGKETYGAGRYLDIPRVEGENYILDFNKAYNPLCAYSPLYNCPYPPPQNRLKVAVEAGEKTPFEHEA
jgi:uncharacterized protein